MNVTEGMLNKIQLHIFKTKTCINLAQILYTLQVQ